jgi:hypothetical protein
MQLCAVAPRTVEVKFNPSFAFKVSLNCDAVKLRKCDYGSVTWLWCGAATSLACSQRRLDFKAHIPALAGSRALIIPPRTCTTNGEPWLGSTAWVSLYLAALLRQCQWESRVVVTF